MFYSKGIWGLENLGGEGDDFHVGGAKLAGNGAEDTGATELAGIVEEHAGIVVEADVRTVGTADLLLGAYNDSLLYSALLDIR